MSVRLVAMYFLSLPLLILGIVSDLIKLPLVILFIVPLWGLLDVIDVLRGEKSMFCEAIWEVSTLGIRIWCMAVGIDDEW